MSKTKTTKKSLPVGSSTMKAMNAYVENLTTAGKSKRTVTRTLSSDEPTRKYRKNGKRVGSGFEPITYDGLIRKSDKKVKQIHTRDDVTERIIALRERVGGLYAKGKFTTSALTAVLTMIDNITFYKCSGEYDRAIDLATDLDSRLSNA
jgi:hypothetical protein